MHCTIKSLSITIWLCASALAVDYPIVCIRVPYHGDGSQPGDVSLSVPEVEVPVGANPGAALVLRQPNGTETVLFANPDANGAVLDPKMSLDGKWVYFSYIKDATRVEKFWTKTGGDIYKINLDTKQVVQLTHGEFTPNKGVAKWESDPQSGALPWQHGTRGLGHPIYNLGACPIPGGRVMFTSNRNGYVPAHSINVHNGQLYVMDEDGKNVEQVGYLNLGSALHPTLLKDGRVLWSTQETQGHRNLEHWSLWASKPDGRTWEPILTEMIAGGAPSPFHFQAQWSDGDIAALQYYTSNNWAHGELFGVPSGTSAQSTVGNSVWGHPEANLNPPLSTKYHHYLPFQRYGMWSVTPWTLANDVPAPNNVGKVSMPSAAPGNKMLVCFSPGPVQTSNKPWVHDKIGLIGKSTASPDDIEIVAESAGYHYLQPVAAVSWAAIYGSEPTEIPELPPGTHPLLPKGTPFGLVGTSSFYKREVATVNDNSAWVGQGDGPEFDSALIDRVRILVQEPTSNFREMQGFYATGNERVRVLGEVPLRKPAGVNDADGNPDTSFLARIPADTPFTFQLVGTDGKALTTAQTWHQLRPGETRVDCNGCHAHHSPATQFEGTAASLPGYAVADLTAVAAAWTKDYGRDVLPVLKAKCQSCHSGGMPAAGIKFDEYWPSGQSQDVQQTMLWGYDARHSRFITKCEEGHGDRSL